MKITYIHHSGFLVEIGTSAFLFDYYKNDIPNLDRFMNIYVFVSHNHSDHFNPEIFSLKDKYDSVSYIISDDVVQKEEIWNGLNEQLLMVKEDMMYESKDFEGESVIIRTLPSTDAGVAFLVEYKKKCIYHAGDLNLWKWKEESDAYNADMTQQFLKQMKKLSGKHIDIAFAPLDPRQEEYYAEGFLELLKTADIKAIVPMHFWEKPEIIHHFLKEHESKLNQSKLICMEQDGDEFFIE